LQGTAPNVADFTAFSYGNRGRARVCARPSRVLGNTSVHGEVAERSNAADCKSVALAASEVRILPSPPFDSAVRPGTGSDGLAHGRPGKSSESERLLKAAGRVGESAG